MNKKYKSPQGGRIPVEVVDTFMRKPYESILDYEKRKNK